MPLTLTCGRLNPIFHLMLQIIIGKQLAVFKKGYNSPGVFTEEMNAPSQPCRAVITIQLTTQHGQCFHSLLHASFNLDFKDDLAWLLIVPFVTTGSLLLVLHGWTQLNPDLLPTVMTKIKRQPERTTIQLQKRRYLHRPTRCEASHCKLTSWAAIFSQENCLAWLRSSFHSLSPLYRFTTNSYNPEKKQSGENGKLMRYICPL